MKRTKTVWSEHQAPELWTPEIPECSMYSYMAQTAVHCPDAPALYFEGKRTTYRALLAQIDRTAGALLSVGVKRDMPVTIVSPNLPQAVITIYALNKIGAVANIVHPLLSEKEIADIVAQMESRILFIPAQFYDKVKNLELPDGTRPLVILYQISDALPFPKSTLYRVAGKRPKVEETARYLLWNTFLQRAPAGETADAGRRGDDVAVIVYTGGTTGKQKGVMLTNRNFNALALESSEIMGIEDFTGTKVLALMPIFHGSGLGCCVHNLLCRGAEVYLLAQYQPDACSKLIFKEKINFLAGVPAFYEALIRSREIEKYPCDFFRFLGSGGDALPEATRNRINRRLKAGGCSITVTDGYGMSECTAGCCYEPYFGKDRQSTGMMIPDMLFKIVEPGTENELPPGEIGELCISGPTVMKGYYRQEALTEEILKTHSDGRIWLHTGDAFSADAEGYLYYQMRLDRMFIVAGYNIYPTEMEHLIEQVRGVDRCCVVGKAAAAAGKRIAVYVIPEKNADPEAVEAAIRAECQAGLAGYSQPSEIRFLDDFPKTKYGKVDFKQLEQDTTL